MLHQECLSLLLGKHQQRRIQSAPKRTPMLFEFRASLICWEKTRERNAPSCCAFHEVEASIPQDSTDPKAKAVRFPAAPETFIGLDQGVLHHIGRGIRIQTHPPGAPEQCSLMPAHQDFESFFVSIQHLGDESCVGNVCVRARDSIFDGCIFRDRNPSSRNHQYSYPSAHLIVGPVRKAGGHKPFTVCIPKRKAVYPS